MNIKLTGVAWVSYDEPLEDYKDFLRQKSLSLWDKNDSRVQEIRSWRVGMHGTNLTNRTN